MPEIGIFMHTLKPSGAELAMVRLLTEVPTNSAVVLAAEDGALRRRIESGGHRVIILPIAPPMASLRRSFGLRQLVAALASYCQFSVRVASVLRDQQIRLVHANGLKSGVYAVGPSLLRRAKLIWHIRDRFDRDYLGRKAPLVRMAMRAFTHGIVANSAATLGTVGAYRGKSIVAYSPLDPTIRPSKERQFTHARLRILMLGRISEWKGQHVLLEALLGVPECIARVTIAGAALFGECDYEARIKEFVRVNSLQDVVDFVGHVDDIQSLIHDHDVLVHASVIAEPFGQVVSEALAAGLPVIAARAGGPMELVEDGCSGLLYDPGSADELAACIRRLFESPALRISLSKAGLLDANSRRAGPIADRVRHFWSRVLDES